MRVWPLRPFTALSPGSKLVPGGLITSQKGYATATDAPKDSATDEDA